MTATVIAVLYAINLSSTPPRSLMLVVSSGGFMVWACPGSSLPDTLLDGKKRSAEQLANPVSLVPDFGLLFAVKDGLETHPAKRNLLAIYAGVSIRIVDPFLKSFVRYDGLYFRRMEVIL